MFVCSRCLQSAPVQVHRSAAARVGLADARRARTHRTARILEDWFVRSLYGVLIVGHRVAGQPVSEDAAFASYKIHINSAEEIEVPCLFPFHIMVMFLF